MSLSARGVALSLGASCLFVLIPPYVRVLQPLDGLQVFAPRVRGGAGPTAAGPGSPRRTASAPGRAGGLPAGIFDYRGQLATEDDRAFAPRALLNSPTGWLKRLHCHVTRLKPGAGYAPHIDHYDVAIVMLAGKVETIGQVLEPCDVVFYAAGEMHGMRNLSAETSRYLVFEFEI